jgi:hypothetical protein
LGIQTNIKQFLRSFLPRYIRSWPRNLYIWCGYYRRRLCEWKQWANLSWRIIPRHLNRSWSYRSIYSYQPYYIRDRWWYWLWGWLWWLFMVYSSYNPLDHCGFSRHVKLCYQKGNRYLGSDWILVTCGLFTFNCLWFRPRCS